MECGSFSRSVMVDWQMEHLYLMTESGNLTRVPQQRQEPTQMLSPEDWDLSEEKLSRSFTGDLLEPKVGRSLSIVGSSTVPFEEGAQCLKTVAKEAKGLET